MERFKRQGYDEVSRDEAAQALRDNSDHVGKTFGQITRKYGEKVFKDGKWARPSESNKAPPPPKKSSQELMAE